MRNKIIAQLAEVDERLVFVAIYSRVGIRVDNTGLMSKSCVSIENEKPWDLN